MASIRTQLSLAVVIGAASLAAAQPPEDVPQLRQYTRYTQGSLPFLRFRIVDGCVTLACQHPGFQMPARSYGFGKKESMSIGYENSRTTFRYERTTPNEQFTVAVAGNGAFELSRHPRGKSTFTPVEYQQNCEKKRATLTLGAGKQRQMLEAGDFWQLALLYPKQCREDLFPLLDLLRPDWQIPTVVARVESCLLARAREDPTADRAHWAALVAQLGDDQFTKREAADRALRAGAAPALNYLRQLDFDRLDAEQQFRVSRIIRKLAGHSEDDSADAVAASLLRDPTVWLALLDRPEKATRQTAARQLAAVLGESIDVDPAADPDSQKAKREQLRSRIMKK